MANNARIDLRMPAAVKAALQKAARKEKVSMTEFILAAAVEKAKK